MTQISNWGNWPTVDADVRTFDADDALRARLSGTRDAIARGLGRCYGDSALAQVIFSSERYNKMLAFDATTGDLTCQAGVSLAEILEVFVPRGWFLPVTPGTKFVSVGGAIASDVHGKNHHKAGSFGDHVSSMDVMIADGSVVTCSPAVNADLFDATCGGMGLTGIILRATFRLKRIESAYIREELITARNLDEIMQLFEESESWTNTVAWIDCLAKGSSTGRSIMMRGEFATAQEARAAGKEPLGHRSKTKANVPFHFPNFALNPLTVRAFNALYYGVHAGKRSTRIIDYDAFFYPLDAILNWNRIYGKRGFTQYQMVFPRETSRDGLLALLNKISASGQGSFLAVLKLFGKQDRLVSFPREGYTLALDFPITPKVLALLDELDVIVEKFGGRLYLTKDSRMKPGMFQRTYPNAAEFAARLKKFDPQGVWSSLQSQRIGLTK